MATFTNQATLSYNGLSLTSNLATGEILETLTINKTAVRNEYVNGDDITYVVNLINSGNTPLNGITLTDDLGGYTAAGNTVYPLAYRPDSVKYFTNNTPLTQTPTVTAGPPLTISDISVPANGSATVTYEATLTDFAPLNTTDSITNTVTATGAGIATPVTDNEVIVPAATPQLRINKTINPNVVTENSPVTYTFLIENLGNTPLTAGDTAVINDVFNPILTNVSASIDNTPLVLNTDYTYNQATGEFNTVPGRITVPAATYTTNPDTGIITTNPGQTTLTVTGTI